MDAKGQAECVTESPHAKPYLTTRLGRLVESWSYSALLWTAVGVVVVCGAIYFLLTPLGDGTNCAGCKNDLSFAVLVRSIYFSIVTFTSLGYGDVVPSGLSRLVACVEVMLGVGLIALFVGRVASERQSAALLLLSSSDIERRLQGIATGLREAAGYLGAAKEVPEAGELHKAVRIVSERLEAAKNYVIYQANQAPQAFSNAGSAIRYFCECLVAVHRQCVEVCMSNIPTAASERRLRSVINRLEALSAALDRIGGVFEKTELRSKMLSKRKEFDVWISQNITNFDLELVSQKCPKSPAAWSHDIHKKIATELSISNTRARKCLDLLEKQMRSDGEE